MENGASSCLHRGTSETIAFMLGDTAEGGRSLKANSMLVLSQTMKGFIHAALMAALLGKLLVLLNTGTAVV